MARRILTFIAVAAGFPLVVSSSAAETDRDKEIEALRATIDRQDAELRDLRTRLDRLEGRQGAEGRREGPPPIGPDELEQAIRRVLETDRVKETGPYRSGWDDGFYLRSDDGAFELRLTAFLQTDLRIYETGHPSNNEFLIRRARPTFEGKLYERFHFKIEPQFSSSGTTLRNAFVDMVAADWFKIRAGRFKMPFSFEELMYTPDRVMIERSLLNNLAPSFENGVEVHGEPFDGVLEYQLAVANGGSGSTRNADDEFTYFARFLLHPLKPTKNPWLEGLLFGASTSWGRQDETDLHSAKYVTPAQTTFFRYKEGVVGTDDMGRVGIEGGWYVGPCSVRGEYAWLGQDVQMGRAVKTNVNFDAFYVQASWLVTGEKATYKRLVPKHNFEPSKGHWGALELAARVGGLDTSEKPFHWGLADANKYTDDARSITAGINWYLNQYVRLSFDYIHSIFEDDITIDGDRLGDEDAFQGRLQIVF